MNLPQKTLDAVLEDWTLADIPERTRAALRLLECMTLRPQELDALFVHELKENGLDDSSIREAANVGFHYNLINRVADAFNYPIPTDKQKARLATILNLSGKLLKGTHTNPVWIQAADGRIRPSEVESGRTHMLSANGKTESVLRQSVEAFVTAQWNHPRANESPTPPELHTYLKKLALHAYRITDDDIITLQNAKYCDEMIYEITIVGAFGAALVGLEKLFEALYGIQT